MSFIFPRERRCICASDDAVQNHSEKEYRNKTISNDLLRRSRRILLQLTFGTALLYCTTARFGVEIHQP